MKRVESKFALPGLRQDSRQDNRKEAAAPAAAASECRALVTLSPAPAPHEHPAARQSATFLAHLIAAKSGVPQTREKRRAEPSEALQAYRAAGALAHQ